MIGLPCVFRLITGLYCPGCGGTRAVFLLLGGHVAESFYYNPVVPYMAVIIPLLILYYAYCRKNGKIFSQGMWKSALFLWIFLIAANFVVKNYYLIFRQVDLLRIMDGRFGF